MDATPSLQTHRQTLKTSLAETQARLGVRDSLQAKLIKKQADLVLAQDNARLAGSAAAFVEASVRTTRQSVLNDLQTIVNDALTAVYGEDGPRLEFELSVKRERTAITPMFLQKTGELEARRKAEGLGCGVSDVAALILRLVLLKASGAEPVLVVDEPFRFLGVTQIPPASELLHRISSQLGIQVIMTTHDDATIEAADRTFCLTKENDAVVVTTRKEKK
jgi:DNA repair exonuclease SbcCD ATPase subunit